ncbi:hypothetical protein WR25_13001 [Diploscapter pachys]|uniref:Uncharacterized protein n=1 Tax=Diploscapter pachys TaxID=2018661 RepID=A0A2A2L199_9BILA|nr:hypothetical protein WR25_13001 [Diploscapter pachys]
MSSGSLAAPSHSPASAHSAHSPHSSATETAAVKRIRKLPAKYVDQQQQLGEAQSQMAESMPNSVDPATISIRSVPSATANVRNGTSSHPQAVYSVTRIGPAPISQQQINKVPVRRQVYVQQKPVQVTNVRVQNQPLPMRMNNSVEVTQNQVQTPSQSQAQQGYSNAESGYTMDEYEEEEEYVEDEGEIQEGQTGQSEQDNGEIDVEMMEEEARGYGQGQGQMQMQNSQSVRYRAIIRGNQQVGYGQQVNQPQYQQYQSRSPFKVPYIPRNMQQQQQPRSTAMSTGFVSKGLGTSSSTDPAYSHNSSYGESSMSQSDYSVRQAPRLAPKVSYIGRAAAYPSTHQFPSAAASSRLSTELSHSFQADDQFGARRKRPLGRPNSAEAMREAEYSEQGGRPNSVEEVIEGDLATPPRPQKNVDLGCGELIERVPSPVLFPYSIPGAEKKTHDHQVLLPGTKLKTFRTDLEPDDVHLVNELGKLTPELLSKYIKQLLNKAVVLGEDQD